MAFRTKKISQMDPKGSNLASTDLLEISELVSGSYVTKSITGAEIIASVPPSITSWGTITGTLSTQTDLQTALNGKVPTTRTLTINGTTQDLSADRTFTISTGITIGTTAITSGTVGRVLFEGTGNVVQESANLFWDNTNGRLGIGTSSPTNDFEIAKNSATPLVLRTRNLNTTTENRISLANDLDEVANFSIFSSLNGNTTLRSKVFLTSTASNGFGFSLFSNSATANFSVLTTTSLTERFRIVGSNGNVLINTTTDAGYKLDVNGTARVSGALTVGGTQLFFNGAFYNTINDRNHFGGAVSISTFLRVGTNANTVASAILQADSTTKGFLPPRMTTTEKNAIASPATGLMVYDTTLNLMALYNGTTWTTL
jgi:hypothetical protein